MVDTYGSFKRSISQFSFDGQLPDIVVACFCTRFPMNWVFLVLSLAFVGHKWFCSDQIPKREGVSNYLKERQAQDVELIYSCPNF